MNVFSRFASFIKSKAQPLIVILDIVANFPEKVEEAGKDLIYVFNTDWSEKKREEKEKETEKIKNHVINKMIPIAGGISVAGAPGILVYTPCQIAGCLAIFKIYKNNCDIKKDIILVMSVVLLGKIGQYTFIFLLDLLKNMMPVVPVGVIVIPFVQKWTEGMLVASHEYCKKNFISEYESVNIEETISAQGDSGIVHSIQKIDYNSEKIEITSSLYEGINLYNQIIQGGKVLYKAQEQLLEDFLTSKGKNSFFGKTHLFYGVAGSGKTIMLANLIPHLCLEFYKENNRNPTYMVYHNNNYLYKLIESEIRISIKNPYLIGQDYKPMLCSDYKICTASTIGDIASNFKFDFILIDEGQDLSHEDFKKIYKLCEGADEDKSIYIFYDNLQNVFDKENQVRDRILSSNFTENFIPVCVRSSKQIISFAISTMLGGNASSKAVDDIKNILSFSKMQKEGMIEVDGGIITPTFCVYENGYPPEVKSFVNIDDCTKQITDDFIFLESEMGIDSLREMTFLILVYSHRSANDIAKGLKQIKKLKIVNYSLETMKPKTKMTYNITQKGQISISNIFDAKGYDADIVYIINPDEKKSTSEVRDRLAFYVACTRAKHILCVYDFLGSNHGIFNDSEMVAGILNNKEGVK